MPGKKSAKKVANKPAKKIEKAIKKSVRKAPKSNSNQIDVNKALLVNFINLQKVMTNLAVKFEDLSGNISKLLQLFELSAKSFADRPLKTPGIDEDFLKKLDALLDQNKTISKGIMMMEERIRNKPRPPMRGFRPPLPTTQSIPTTPQQNPQQNTQQNTPPIQEEPEPRFKEFTRSISE